MTVTMQELAEQHYLEVYFFSALAVAFRKNSGCALDYWLLSAGKQGDRQALVYLNEI